MKCDLFCSSVMSPLVLKIPRCICLVWSMVGLLDFGRVGVGVTVTGPVPLSVPWGGGIEVLVQDEVLRGVSVLIFANGMLALVSLWVIVPLCVGGKAGAIVC